MKENKKVKGNVTVYSVRPTYGKVTVEQKSLFPLVGKKVTVTIKKQKRS